MKPKAMNEYVRPNAYPSLSSYLVVLVLLAGNPVAYVNAQSQADPTVRDQVYLVVFEPGPAWVEGKPVGEQNLREHGRFLMERYADGQMVQAGPFTNDTGGAVILRAESLADAKALVATDPAVVSEVFVATVSPWRWVEWEYHLDRARLRKLQAQFMQNVAHEDVVAPEKMIHPDFVAINSNGTINNRETYLKEWSSAQRTSFSIPDEEIRLFGNTALVISKIAYAKDVEGETVQGNALYTNTYIKENGTWVCVQMHITPIKTR